MPKVNANVPMVITPKSLVLYKKHQTLPTVWEITRFFGGSYIAMCALLGSVALPIHLSGREVHPLIKVTSPLIGAFWGISQAPPFCFFKLKA